MAATENLQFFKEPRCEKKDITAWATDQPKQRTHGAVFAFLTKNLRFLRIYIITQSEDNDLIARMLILVFAVRTCYKTPFLAVRLKYVFRVH